MATASATWAPASGRDYVDINATYAGEAVFPTVPVSGQSQIDYPDTGTMDGAGVLTIADGTYTLYHITPAGQMEAVSYTKASADETAPALSSPVGASTGQTTASGTVSTDEGNGDLYYLATTDGTGDPYSDGDSQSVSGTGEQSVNLSGLSAGETYTILYGHEDAAGNQSTVVESSSFTTDAASGPSDVTATATWSPAAGRDYVTLASGFDSSVFEFFEKQPAIGWDIDFNASEITFSDLAVIEPVDDFEDVSVIYAYDPDTQLLHYGEVDASQMQTADPVAQVPQGAITPSVSSITHNEATVSFTYDAADADSFEHSTDGTTWTTVTSPFTRTGLAAETLYDDGEIRAVNATGNGTAVSYSFTTEAEPATAPEDAPTLGTITKDHESASIPFGTVADATAYEYSTDGTTWADVTSPLVLSGLDAETAYSGQIRGYNDAGPGPAVNYSFTTDEQPVDEPQGLISYGTASVASTSWSLPFTYSDNDEDGFQYRIDGGTWISATSPITMMDADPETAYLVETRAYNDGGYSGVASTTITTLEDGTDPQPDETVVERVYTLSAYKDKMPAGQSFSFYQGDRVRLMIDHPFDMAGKQLLFRMAPKTGAVAGFTLTSENDQFIITSTRAETIAVSNRVWQIIMKETSAGSDGEISRVVVAEGSCSIKPRIKET